MSLRARLVVGLAVVAFVLVGAAVLVSRTTESYLLDRIDAQLQSAPVRTSDDHDSRGGPGPSPFTNLNSLYVAEVQDDGSITTLQVPYSTGTEVLIPKVSAERALAAVNEAGTHHAFTVGTEPSSDTRYRVLAVTGDAGGLHANLLVALPLTDVDASVSRLVGLEALATVLILGLLGVVAFWVLRLGVRPIKRMTETATAIAAGDLSHRVPDVKAGTEAGELGAALNTMMGHIETAFALRAASEDRLRRFVADASHELRTPVTTIRGYAELYRRGGLADADAMAQAMRRTEQEAIRMGSLIEDLLLLARLDQGRPLEQQPVDLSALVRDAVTDARVVAPDRVIDATAPAEVVVVGDDSRLRQVIANLVTNALVHTPAGTALHLAARGEGDLGVIEVVDEGPGMTDEVAEQAFERFYRADASRSRAHGGAGLGLSIVQAIVAAHGGRVAIRTAPGAGTTVRVELPLHEGGGRALGSDDLQLARREGGFGHHEHPAGPAGVRRADDGGAGAGGRSDDEAGAGPPGLTDGAEDRSADRRAAEEHHRLQRQHPTAHRRSRPYLHDRGRRRDERDAAGAHQDGGRESHRQRGGQGERDERAGERGGRHDQVADLDGRTASSGERTDEGADAQHREQHGERAVGAVERVLDEEGDRDAEVEREGADQGHHRGGTQRSGTVRT